MGLLQLDRAFRRSTRMHHSFSVVAYAAIATLAVMTSFPSVARAQFDCSSSDPARWPPPAKPYFMIAVDTSGSMTNGVGVASSCGYGSDRRAHARCAVRNTVNAYSGQVNFGLASFAPRLQDCSGATCYTNCTAANPPSCNSCGCEPTNLPNSEDRRGANILVPMLVDIGSPASNVPSLLSWVDNSCSGSTELFAGGNTPLNGVLRDMYRYYSNQWVSPHTGGPTFVSPLTSAANGEKSCRSLNVILITDGGETCDTTADAVDAAADLYTGFVKDGITWRVRTRVINFAGGAGSGDQIADAGDDGLSNSSAVAEQANDENDLSIALSKIIGGAVAPEVCNNVDDNCNGCVDEGYRHYCNVGQTCCSLARATCLAQYTASITPADPDGDLTLLPCTSVAQSQASATWLCFDPKDQCDGVDNNCFSGVDEGATKCGNPLHCPLPEVCNGQDDDCDGLTDEGGVCGSCTPSPEICDGCDNDCDGIADEGVGPIPCGLTSPPNCAGQRTCKPAQAVAVPGGCVAGGGLNTCSNNPQPEVCDGLDNNCNGAIDDGVPPTPCVPPATPNNLVYGPPSQCVRGTQACGGTCQGFIGPSSEICDGIDNDCDGIVDENAFGVGQPCGSTNPPCSPGTVACVNGALVCQGGVQPTGEVCDGIDNNCNGQTDEAPLMDAPMPGQNGCWTNPGACCTFDNPGAIPDLQWCPPIGGNCFDSGGLMAPCSAGVLTCSGPLGWVCLNPRPPVAEVCDGQDNNCNGQIDEGNFPQEGQPCGSDTGECSIGAIDCQNGMLDCVGDVGPVMEVCDGLDNDCDGVIDNGIPTGGPCAVAYDMALYPNDRTALPCQPGILQCDGMGGTICVGGVGPQPELCDGLDNDCDGTVDEAGPGPDGIDLSANPFPPPNANLGDICGTDVGACTEGNYACVGGMFTCLGSTTAQPESCDCEDNDCNGVIDNPNPNNIPPLCSPGKDCIQSTFGCQCASPCGSGEFPCPGGQVCEEVKNSETGMVLGDYCVVNPCPTDCATQTGLDGNGDVICAPAGTVLDNCFEPPVCVCKGQSGCRPPCEGVQCEAPLVCTNYGPDAGTCVANNCFNVPCQGCDQTCNNLGTCVENPCKENSCPPDQVCRPSDDFTTFACVGSCAGVDCGAGTICEDGLCVPTCDPPCPAGKTCDDTQIPPTCVDSLCTDMSCPVGGCCDPLTGQCGTCPCEGVICPDQQKCVNDQCVEDAMGTGGAGGTGGQGEGAGAQGANGPGATGSGADGPNGVWGLATGGGGCQCDFRGSAPPPGTWITVGLVIFSLARRRRRDVSSSSDKEVA
jgi:hypothetical protein